VGEREVAARKAAAEKKLAAGHEQVARQTHEIDTLKSELETLKAELESSRHEQQSLRSELAELRSSHFLSGAKKKLDIREVDGFAQAARSVRSSGRASMDYDRLYTLWQAVRSAPPGYPVVEVGTYRGGSARFISETLQAGNQSPRFYVCDTFAGHPRTDPDIDTAHHGSHKFANASAADTAEYLSGYHNLEMLVGDIVETSSQLIDESFGFVHVDVDVYPATDHCLRFFAPRLAEGALILVDDYGFVTCPGVRLAADEFIAEFPEFRLLHLLTGQAVLSRR
jgi:predicted O-methyltransferase YrrM